MIDTGLLKHFWICTWRGHRWTDWYPLGPTTQGHHCLRCNDVGQRESAHSDGNVEPTRCSFWRSANRCTYPHAHEGPHSWESAHIDGQADA